MLEDWGELTGEFAAWFGERGYMVAIQSYNVAPTRCSTVLNASKR